jgi:hypothetical protein
MIKKNLKAIKEEAFVYFTQNTIGEMTNSKNQKHMAKLKSEFKTMKETLFKKNQDLTVKYSEQVLD